MSFHVNIAVQCLDCLSEELRELGSCKQSTTEMHKREKIGKWRFMYVCLCMHFSRSCEKFCVHEWILTKAIGRGQKKREKEIQMYQETARQENN